MALWISVGIVKEPFAIAVMYLCAAMCFGYLAHATAPIIIPSNLTPEQEEAYINRRLFEKKQFWGGPDLAFWGFLCCTIILFGARYVA